MTNPNNHQHLHNTPENRDYWQRVVGIQEPDVEVFVDPGGWPSIEELDALEEQANYWLAVIEWEDRMRQDAADHGAWYDGMPSTCLKCDREKDAQAQCDCELHHPSDIQEETKEAQEALLEQQYHEELAREQADEDQPFSQAMCEDPTFPATLAVDEDVCERCEGTGWYDEQAGAICFRCKGKRFQNRDDKKRNQVYDAHHPNR